MKLQKILILVIIVALAALIAAQRKTHYILGEDLGEEFGEGFAVLRTKHWVIFYSTTEEKAREVGETLERTREIFIDTFARLELELDDEVGVLICELYKDPASYRDHMKSVGDPREPPSFGWYSKATNRLTLIEPDIDEVLGLEISLIWSAAHEGAHQLSYDLGPLVPGVAYPPWLVEGLAGAFETRDPKAEFGPHSGYVTQKVQIIQDYVKRSDYAPILELSGMRRPPSGTLRERFATVPKERIQIYAQGASLVIYLIEHRPEGFKVYLENLSSSGRWRSAFKDAFGDVDALESDWKRWLLELGPAS